MTQSDLQLESERQISDMKPTCEYKIPALVILRHKWNSFYTWLLQFPYQQTLEKMIALDLNVPLTHGSCFHAVRNLVPLNKQHFDLAAGTTSNHIKSMNNILYKLNICTWVNLYG